MQLCYAKQCSGCSARCCVGVGDCWEICTLSWGQWTDDSVTEEVRTISGGQGTDVSIDEEVRTLSGGQGTDVSVDEEAHICSL